MPLKLAAGEISSLDPYKFMAVIGKRVIHPGGRASTQELLRHADIRTTMNIYTQAVPAALREANSKVVRLVIPAQVA